VISSSDDHHRRLLTRLLPERARRRLDEGTEGRDAAEEGRDDRDELVTTAVLPVRLGGELFAIPVRHVDEVVVEPPSRPSPGRPEIAASSSTVASSSPSSTRPGSWARPPPRVVPARSSSATATMRSGSGGQRPRHRDRGKRVEPPSGTDDTSRKAQEGLAGLLDVAGILALGIRRGDRA
jgi:hypothetical protein